MRIAFISSILALVSVLSSCSTETGILLNASAEPELASQITSLRFFVGEAQSSSDPQNLYFSEATTGEPIELGSNRDLSTSPYSLLVRPRVVAQEVRVAVAAFDVDKTLVGFASIKEPLTFRSGEVLSWSLNIKALAQDVEVAGGNCLRWIPEGGGPTLHIVPAEDMDCDGSLADDDCNDFDDAINPEAPEVCDGIDNNCDKACDEGYDDDEDGVSKVCGSIVRNGKCVGMAAAPDCDDNDSQRYPGNAEVCDHKDNDCDGYLNEDLRCDLDGDGFESCKGPLGGECDAALRPRYYDCDDDNASIHPGALELCDGIDNDCDDTVDNEYYACAGTQDPAYCMAGVRLCDLVNGTYEGSCIVANGALADGSRLPDVHLANSFCTDYSNTCRDASATALDPLACMLRVPNPPDPPSALCTVNVDSTEPCGTPRSRVVRVVPAGFSWTDLSREARACTYSIVGGQEQQGYRVRLRSRENIASTPLLGTILAWPLKVARCQVYLEVESLVPGAGLGEAMIPINFNIHGRYGLGQVIWVKLEASRGACGDKPGLECSTTGWTSPPAPMSLP